MTNTINAQEYLNKNLTDKNIKEISLDSSKELLTSKLVIQDYPDLEEINLTNHELTFLTIVNCPQLKKINVRNNKLSELEIAGDNINEIIAGSNELTTLNLTNCPNLKKLMVPDNPLLTTLENLNLTTIKDININNTLVNLAEEYEKLKEQNKNLCEIINTVDEGGYQKKLVLVEPIKTPRQAEEAIQCHLADTEKKWRAYFESQDPNIAKKYPLFGIRFQFPQNKRKAQQILKLIIGTQTSRNYEALIKEWNEGEEYNADYDFDFSLKTLIELAGTWKYILKKEQNFVEEVNPVF